MLDIGAVQSYGRLVSTHDRALKDTRDVTHWLEHSLVLASDCRIAHLDLESPALRSRRDGLAGVGAHHVLTYASTTEPGRLLVILALHPHEPVLELLRSRVLFDWFDAVGVDEIPAVFAGELVERHDLAGEPWPMAPEVMVSIVTSVDDVINLVLHVRETEDDLRTAGVRRLSIFRALDDAREVMMLLQIDDELHARHWLRHSNLSVEWLGKAGIGAYPPVFVGRLQQASRVADGNAPSR